MSDFEPLYLESHRNGKLKGKIEKARNLLSNCNMCPRTCGVDRLSDELGICKTGERAWVSSYQPHFGEEAPLVGSRGSGTIFFTHCNLLCNFCQNYDISHQGNGRAVSDIKLSEMMIFLQGIGCHNINFVTPTHVVPQILSALEKAIEKGLSVPLVYNSGGYDNVETLEILDGVIDIYMPDFKFWDSKPAQKTCDAPDYKEIACRALKEMYRQVGDLQINRAGIAERGLLVRHLVMPSDYAGTRGIMKFIAEEISTDTYVNIMPQYRTCGTAYEIPELTQRLLEKDFRKAIDDALEAGITRLDNRRLI